MSHLKQKSSAVFLKEPGADENSFTGVVRGIFGFNCYKVQIKVKKTQSSIQLIAYGYHKPSDKINID